MINESNKTNYSLCQAAVGDTAARYGGHWQAGHGGEGTQRQGKAF